MPCFLPDADNDGMCHENTDVFPACEHSRRGVPNGRFVVLEGCGRGGVLKYVLDTVLRLAADFPML